MTDPIADMLTRIRNAARVKKETAEIPFSKIKLEIAKILKKENFIDSYEEMKKDPENKFGGLLVNLKYEGGQSVITSIQRVSKPGRRVYASVEELPRVLNGLGIAIVSTPKGLMTNKEAKKAGLGGEVLCEVY